MRDSVTGDIEYMGYFGMTLVPTLVVGNSSASIKASLIDKMLLLYFDQGQVKDLRLKGESFWFTGTPIGYQYGTTGITRGMGVGGDPYILLRSVLAQPPEDLPIPPQKKRKEDDAPPKK